MISAIIGKIHGGVFGRPGGRHWKGTRSVLPQGGNGAGGETLEAPPTGHVRQSEACPVQRASAAQKI